MAEDLKIHPEWTAYTPKYGSKVDELLTTAASVANKVASACPFAYLW